MGVIVGRIAAGNEFGQILADYPYLDSFSVKASGSIKVFFGPSGGDEVSQKIVVTVGPPAA